MMRRALTRSASFLTLAFSADAGRTSSSTSWQHVLGGNGGREVRDSYELGGLFQQAFQNGAAGFACGAEEEDSLLAHGCLISDCVKGPGLGALHQPLPSSLYTSAGWIHPGVADEKRRGFQHNHGVLGCCRCRCLARITHRRTNHGDA